MNTLHRFVILPAAAAAMLFASTAAAQVSVVDTIPNNFTVNADDCASDDTFTFRYELDFTGSLQASWTIRMYDELIACPDLYEFEPDHIYVDWQKDLTPIPLATPFIPFNESEEDITAKELFGAELCGGARGNYLVCLYMTDIQPSTNSDTPVLDQNLILTPAFPLNAVVDSGRPEQAEIDNVIEGDESLTIVIDEPSPQGNETYTYVIQYRACVSLDAGGGSTDDGGATSDFVDAGLIFSECDAPGGFSEVAQDDLTLGDLVNDIEYEFRVALVDDADNVGAFSDLATGIPSVGFTPNGVYDGDPNPLSFRPPDSCDPGEWAEEGCSQSATRYSSLKIFALVMFGLYLRRRRTRRIHKVAGRRTADDDAGRAQGER